MTTRPPIHIISKLLLLKYHHDGDDNEDEDITYYNGKCACISASPVAVSVFDQRRNMIELFYCDQLAIKKLSLISTFSGNICKV